MGKPLDEWNVGDYGAHYVDVIHRQPNGLGQHVSEHFGQSHEVLNAASKLFGTAAINTAVDRAFRERRQNEGAGVDAAKVAAVLVEACDVCDTENEFLEYCNARTTPAEWALVLRLVDLLKRK